MTDITLSTSKMMSLVCAVVAGIYAAVELEPAPFIVTVLTMGPHIAVILWLQKDAQRARTPAVLDWGMFLWYGWPLLIPWYAWKTRGRAGWRLAAGLIGLIVAPFIVGAAVPWLVYGVRYALWSWSAR
jgi:hypothetical protein